jgi:uncharacterized repeat protein (TIGR01451 family)
VLGNTATEEGGGLFLRSSDAVTLSGNTVISNVAGGVGGGLCLHGSDATLSGNTIVSNVANLGGGLALGYDSAATLNENAVLSNTASDQGGGLYLWMSDATLSGNTLLNNAANRGGGNQAADSGSGVYVYEASARLVHNTVARNSGGDGSGVHVTNWYMSGYSSDVALTNTILVSHTVGIHVSSGNVATLEATLWGDGDWANGTDWGGGGTIVTGTVNLWGDPAFLAPEGGDYHIGSASAAHNAGVNAGVNQDMDGQPRPMGSGYDIGADEFHGPGLEVVKRASPSLVQAGEQLTYTIYVTNTGSVTLTAIVTDILPGHVTPVGVLTWTPTISTPNPVWTQTVVVTVEMGYAGLLTNVVQVTAEEGVSGTYTETTESQVTPVLAVTKRASASSVQAGEQLTYTIRITNTGNVDLHATVTDVLPSQVVTTDPLTWTPTITAPGGIWEGRVVVTVEMGYAGLLTNVVQVTTEEGASGTCTETVLSLAPHLEVIKWASSGTVNAGEQLTYTIRITNTGNVDLHATVTDVLPSHVTSDSPLNWTPIVTAPGGVWEQTVVVTVEMGYAGPLTNVVQVTTEEGASGTYTETTESQVTPMLAVTKRASASSVQAGEQLTYTIRITNTGNVDLHATVTDVLPSQVVTTDPLTWTPTITAPGGVWEGTVVVTVEMGYAGLLTNVVQVTTVEGASGTCTETVLSLAPHLEVTKWASSDTVNAGEQLTYTIRITNTGNVDLHATVTDVLPSHVTSSSSLHWTPTITAPDGVWEETVVVTVEMGYAGLLTNVVQVTTEEGASGTYTETTESQVTPMLVVTKRASASSVQAGEQLTYTIRITNTGNVDLHATVTDVLPSHVTPTGTLTWTPTISAPGGVWEQTVVVTVETGYSGVLTNTVQVTTEEGASGGDTETCTSIGGYDVYLPLVLRQYP